MIAKSSPQLIGQVIDALTRQLGIKTKIEQYSVVDLWPSIVGSQVARITSVERIEKNTLFVKVSNAPWRTELTFRKNEILKKIQDTINSESIRDIRFR